MLFCYMTYVPESRLSQQGSLKLSVVCRWADSREGLDRSWAALVYLLSLHTGSGFTHKPYFACIGRSWNQHPFCSAHHFIVPDFLDAIRMSYPEVWRYFPPMLRAGIQTHYTSELALKSACESKTKGCPMLSIAWETWMSLLIRKQNNALFSIVTSALSWEVWLLQLLASKAWQLAHVSVVSLGVRNAFSL